MTGLTTLLDTPIDWAAHTRNPDVEAFLNDLQANILKGHGRFHTGNIFISFAGMSPSSVARVIRAFGNHCTSALTQLTTNRKVGPFTDGGPVRCLFLSASGYKALGGLAKTPDGAAFRSGMEARGNILGDPPRAGWNVTGWQGQAPDAMVLVADRTDYTVTADLEAAEHWLDGTGAKVLFVERGLQQTRQFRPDAKAEGVEHFGYVDGRSQPLFLQQDVDAEGIPEEPGVKPGEKKHWSPAFKPSQFIVADPNGAGPLSAGSYFVFRKLEQNVRGFNKAETAIATALFGADATQDQKDRAGAMVVGRFEDGTPLVLGDRESKAAVTNDFSYAADPDGLKCPFHAHIRKVNPRGDIERQFHIDDESAGRAPIMARRGITYGPERPHTPDGADFSDDGTEPETGSGLLFMAYMASIEAQFEFTQQSWADNRKFVLTSGVGIDPVIGQSGTAADRKYTFQDCWSGGPAKSLGFDQFVTMQGGEYFFAPSLKFLRSVGL